MRVVGPPQVARGGNSHERSFSQYYLMGGAPGEARGCRMMGEMIFPTIAAPRDPLSKRDGPWEFAGGKRVFPLAPVSVGKVLPQADYFFTLMGYLIVRVLLFP